jgi:hypothetical protein
MAICSKLTGAEQILVPAFTGSTPGSTEIIEPPKQNPKTMITIAKNINKSLLADGPATVTSLDRGN